MGETGEPRALSAELVARTVYDAVVQCAVGLREDVRAAIERAAEDEHAPRARAVLGQMIENAQVAREDGVPLCQDTGTVWVRLEAGWELSVPGNALSLVDDAVARAYADARLRMSVVRDAVFDRSNTADNTPAFCDVALRPGCGATVHVMLKGGGSDNASRVVMLPPGEGAAGVRRVVLECVREKAATHAPRL